METLNKYDVRTNHVHEWNEQRICVCMRHMQDKDVIAACFCLGKEERRFLSKHEGRGMKRSSLVIQSNLGFIRFINKVLYDEGIVNWVSSHSLVMKRMVIDYDYLMTVDSDPCPHLVLPSKESLLPWSLSGSHIILSIELHLLLCDLLYALVSVSVSDEFNLLASFILVESAESWVKTCIWNLLFVCFNML